MACGLNRLHMHNKLCMLVCHCILSNYDVEYTHAPHSVRWVYTLCHLKRATILSLPM